MQVTTPAGVRYNRGMVYNFNMVFSTWLAEQMAAAGLTQTDIADALGVQQQAVSKWLNNQTKPGSRNLRPLSDILGVALNDLCDAIEHSDPIRSLRAQSPLELGEAQSPEERIARLEREVRRLQRRR